MSNRRRLSFGERVGMAASLVLRGAVPAGRFGPLVSAADWNGRFKPLDDVHVDEVTAANLSGVWACVTLLADTMSLLPVGVFQRQGPSRKALPDHPVNKLLAGSVNDYQGRRAFMKCIERARQLKGNGLAQVERDASGAPVGLWPLCGATLKRENGKLFYEVMTGGERSQLAAGDVIHIKGSMTDESGMVGISPITAARNALDLTIAAERFGRDFFKNDMKAGGFFTMSGRVTDTVKRNFADSVDKQKQGERGREGHRIVVLEENTKFVPTTIAPEEAQFLSTREFQLEELARFWRIPLVLLQSMTKSTSWGTGVEQLMIGFASYTLAPLAASLEEELSLKLLSDEERSSGVFVRVSVDGIARGDATSRAGFYASGIQNGWLLPNEARAREDLNPIEGGDAPPPPRGAAPPNERLQVEDKPKDDEPE
jgi:HK97 family phage portal protein